MGKILNIIDIKKNKVPTALSSNLTSNKIIHVIPSTCVCCGREIPEGEMVCWICQHKQF